MKYIPVSINAPRLRRIVKSIVLFAAFAVGLILLPTPASMQSADALPTDDAKQDLLQSPQTSTRPDILWMRGGNVNPSVNGKPYFFSDAQRFLTASDGEIKIWRATDGVLLKTIFAFKDLSVQDLVLSPNQQLIAAIGNDATTNVVKLFNAADGSFIRTIPISGSHIVFFPDSQSFVIDSGNSGIIERWDISGARIRSYSTPMGQNGQNFPTITGYPALSPDGAYVSGTLTGNSYLVILNVGDGSVVKNYSFNSTGAANGRGTLFYGNNYILAARRNAAELAVWKISDTCTGSVCDPRVILINGFNDASIKNLAFLTNGLLAMGGRAIGGQSVNRLWNSIGWDTQSSGLIRSYDSNNISSAAAVELVPEVNSDALLSVSNNMKLWSVTDGSLIRNLDGHSAVLTSVAYSPDGQTIASATNAITGNPALPTIYLWRATDGTLLRTLNFGTGATGGVNSIAFSPDSQTVAVGGNDGTGNKVKIFNANTGTLTGTINGAGIGAIVFSPNGLTVATGSSGNSTGIYRVSDGGLTQSLAASPQALSFSPDGQRITDGKNIYQVSNGTSVYSLNSTNNPSYPNGAAYSPNSQLIAAVYNFGGAGSTSVVKLYNAADGSFVRDLVGHTSGINAVTFSSDSATLFSAGNDGTARLWRVSDGTLLQTYDDEIGFANVGSGVVGAAFSPDGKYFTYGRSIDATLVKARNPYGPPPATFTISGTVTRNGAGLSGAAVNLSGDTSGTMTTDSAGNYSFSVNEGGSYTVTPALTGSVFAPASQTFNYISGNQTADFTSNLYTISGTITRGGSSLSGVSVALSGSATNTTTTNASGNYSFTVAEGGNYTITPSLAGNTFTPANQTFNAVTANQTANFTAPLITHTISGNITRGGAALNGATVNLSGSASGSTTTDNSGNYSLTVNEGGNYTVTPALAGNIFTPASQTFSNVTTNQTANFTALFSTYTISGNVKADGANLQGATVSLTGTQTQTTTTDTNGNYTFTANTNGSYTVTVSKNGFTFNPANQVFNNLQANQTANFQNGVPLCAPLSAGLIAWFKGEGSAVDSSGNGHDGALQSGTTTGTGKVGQSFVFNGTTNYVQAGNQSTLTLTGNQVSLSAWIYPTGAGSGGAGSGGAFMSKEGEYAIGRFSNGNIYWAIANTSPGWSAVDTGYNTPLNQWTHLSLTYNGTNVALYANGTLVSLIAATGNIGDAYPANNELFIGSRQLGNEHFAGLVDEAQVYNRALTAAEAQQISNAGSAGVCIGTQLPATNGKLAFTSLRDGNREIYTMNADGTNQTRITNNSAVDDQPAFSPDGSKIIFSSTRDGNYEIYSMNADGSNPVRLTNNSAADTFPKFSGNGLRITFISDRDGNSEIYIMNADGTGQTRLTNTAAADEYPEFSPDGSKIVFTSLRDGNREIYSMNPDGTSQTRITNNSAIDDQPAFSPDGTKIIFSTNRDGNYEIYTMNANGTNPVRLTNVSAPDTFPKFSPDGTKITFISDRDGNIEVYAMNADGTGQTRLTNNTVTDEYPAWQPVRSSANTNTGTNGKIAFQSDRTGNFEIFTMNADGSGQTNVSNNNAADYFGEWSPDGSKIVFRSSRNSNDDIYTMNADGTNQTRLTTNAANDDAPSWSPDGTRIVFTSSRVGNNGYGIYVMNADGTNQTSLTNSSEYDYFPKFSPDGSRIAFRSDRTGNNEIFVMNADGTNPINLTNNSSYDDEPSWSPDGSKIAFFSNRSGNGEIWVMNSNGTNPVNLSNNSADDLFPTFSPDGSKIAFTSYRNSNYDIYVMNAADGNNQTRLTTDTNVDQYPSWQRTSGNGAVAPASNLNVTFANVTQAGNTVATPLTTNQLPALPTGYTLPANAPMYDIRTSAGYSGNITVSFNVPNVSSSATCANLRSLHYENGAWTTAINGTPSYNSAAQTCTVSQTVTSLSPFVVAQGLAPTAASVSISGRVITPQQLGLTNALVTLTDSQGNSRTTLTRKLGAFRFANVAAGETYILRVSSKRYSYAPRVVTVNEDLTELIFEPMQ